MANKGFLLVKNSKLDKKSNLEISKLDGFMFTPKNRVNYDGVTVKKLVMINPSFTEDILKRKIKNRLEIYLRFIVSIINEDDDDTDITDLRAALNDLTRYKAIIRNKYLLYLDKRYAAMLLKKIEILEQELKNKIIYHREPKEIEDVNRRSR